MNAAPIQLVRQETARAGSHALVTVADRSEMAGEHRDAHWRGGFHLKLETNAGGL